MSVKHGPVTLLSVVESGSGRLSLLVAEGESVPGPVMEIGNTNSRYRFPIGARRFVNDWNGHGPAHHCAVGVGHVAAKIEKLGQLLRVDVNSSLLMVPNPFLGARCITGSGGLAAASFYIPYQAGAALGVGDVLAGGRRLQLDRGSLGHGAGCWCPRPWTPSAPRRASAIVWTYVFGVLWGLGGLTFGLTVRYLGIALGVAIALGLCNAFGTLVPPIFAGDFGEIAGSTPGRVILLGVAVSLAGIAISGLAGVSKERELTSDGEAGGGAGVQTSARGCSSRPSAAS